MSGGKSRASKSPSQRGGSGKSKDVAKPPAERGKPAGLPSESTDVAGATDSPGRIRRLFTLNFQAGKDGEKPTLEEALKKNKIMSLLLAIVFVWGTFSIIREIGVTAYNTVYWQAGEIAKLETVRPDMPISKLQDTFGQADHVEKMNPKDPGDQMIWKGRGYFLVVHEVDQIVTSYAIHACNSQIRPSVGIGAGKVTANETTLSGPDHSAWPPMWAFYNWAPSFITMYEGRGGGRAEAFQEVFWGVDVACQWESPEDMPLFLCTTKADKASCTKNVDERIRPEDVASINKARDQLVVQVVGAQSPLIEGFAPQTELIVPASVFERLGTP